MVCSRLRSTNRGNGAGGISLGPSGTAFGQRGFSLIDGSWICDIPESPHRLEPGENRSALMPCESLASTCQGFKLALPSPTPRTQQRGLRQSRDPRWEDPALEPALDLRAFQPHVNWLCCGEQPTMLESVLAGGPTTNAARESLRRNALIAGRLNRVRQ